MRFDFNQTRTSGRGYYTGVAFRIAARDSSGTEYRIVDGGLTDWTQQLLSNRKERLLISGMGSERLVSLFGQWADNTVCRRTLYISNSFDIGFIC